jgi:hypothetical protein
MFEEYWKRKEFVILHGALLFIYLIMIVYSIVLFWREKRALKLLNKGSGEAPDGSESITGLSTSALSTKSVRKSAIVHVWTDLKQGISSPPEGKSINSLDLVLRAMSTPDDLIRFCVNGFVVVGLMGTLAAFYEMWRQNNTPDQLNLPSSSPNSTYLEGMATALVVSFIGLILALCTNLIFSIVKAFRHSLLMSASRSLPKPSHVDVQGSMVSLAVEVTNRLEKLGKQLSDQNQTILNDLAGVMQLHNEQMKKLFSQAVGGLQGLMQHLSRDMLQVLGNLTVASDRLSSSSEGVAKTMGEVSKGLERTKDIGKIVNRLENMSENIVTGVSVKFEKATNAWADKLSDSVQEHIKATRLQTDLIETMLKQLTLKSITEVKAVASDVRESLGSLTKDFADETKEIAGHWMTQMSSNTNEMVRVIEGIVNGWSETVTNTSSNINTTLVGSRELVNEIAEKVKSLNDSIEQLHILLLELEDRAGAPVHLSRVAEDLSLTRQSLGDLIRSLSQNLALGELKTVLELNSTTLGNIEQRLGVIRSVVNKDVIKAIEEVQGTLIPHIQSIESILKGQSSNGTGKEIIQALNSLSVHLSSLQQDIIKGRVSVRVHQNSQPSNPPIRNPKKKSWSRTLMGKIGWRRPRKQKGNEETS